MSSHDIYSTATPTSLTYNDLVQTHEGSRPTHDMRTVVTLYKPHTKRDPPKYFHQYTPREAAPFTGYTDDEEDPYDPFDLDSCKHQIL